MASIGGSISIHIRNVDEKPQLPTSLDFGRRIRSDGLRGFTLVELLVSIAVIALLTALLIPATGKVREGANRIKCAANLKQIGVAMFSFAAEKDGYLPGAVTWDREIAPYLGYTGVVTPINLADQVPVLKCPADNVERTTGRVRSYKPNTISNADANMGVLAWASSAKKDSRRVHELPHPSVTILVTETFSADNVQFDKNNAILGAPGWISKLSKVPAFPDGRFYHGPGQNYLFCDGHVELVIPLEGLLVVLPNWDGGRWRALPKP